MLHGEVWAYRDSLNGEENLPCFDVEKALKLFEPLRDKSFVNKKRKLSTTKHEVISSGVNITQNTFKILLQHFSVYFIPDNLKC